MDTIKQLVKVLMLATLVLALGACSMFKSKSQEEALNDMQWSYAKDAITLHVSSTKDLNRWDGQAHNLLMLVAQFEDPSAFEPYNNSSHKLSALLLADTPPPGLLNIQRVFIKPDSEQSYTFARVDKAKYLGIALGYQHLDPRRSVRIYQIGADISHNGLIFKEYNAIPQPLRLELLLGGDSIYDSLSSRQEDIKPVVPKAGPWINDNSKRTQQ